MLEETAKELFTKSTGIKDCKVYFISKEEYERDANPEPLASETFDFSKE